MIVSPDVPWPDAWPRWPHLRVYYVLVFGGLVNGLVALGWLLRPLMPGELQPADVAFFLLIEGFAVSCFAYGLVFFLHPYFRRRSRIETAGPALIIRYRSARVLVAMFGVPYAVAGGLILLGVGLRLNDGGVVVYAGVPIAVGAVLGVLALPVHRGRYALRLTPDEVQWHTVQRTVAVSWDIVYKIRAEHTPEYEGPGGQPYQGLWIHINVRAFRIAGSGRAPEDDILIPAGQLSAAPALTFWLLEHYLRHPEHRHELGTDAAVERIRRGPE